MAVQWCFDKEFSFEDKNFAKIYRFFTIETPVENTSRREKSLEFYGWNGKKIVYALKREIPSLSKNWKTVKTVEQNQNRDIENIEQDVSKLCKQNSILEEVTDRREIFIHANSKNTKTMSLLYAIRCSFAHGAFNKTEFCGEKFYFLENRNRGKLKGRIVVKESTLLKIIEIIENSEKYQKGAKKNDKEKN